MSDRGTFGWKGTGKRALEFPAGEGVATAPTGRARLRYNEATGSFEVSFSGSAYLPIETTGTSPWNLDTSLVPNQIEPDNPANVVAVSSASVDVPAGEKMLVEATPPAGAAVMDLAATGQGSDVLPALGSSVLHIRRLRTGGFVGVGSQENFGVLVDLDVHPADVGVRIEDAICIRSTDASTGVGSVFHEGIVCVGNADGNGHIFEHVLICLDTPAWWGAGNVTAGLAQPPDIAIYTSAFGSGAVAGEPSGEILLSVGNTTGVRPPDIVLNPGVDLAVPAAGPHGNVLVKSNAAAQTPVIVRAAAGQTADLHRWNTSASVTRASIGPNGEITANAVGAAAGSDSTPVRWQGVTSGGAREFSATLDAAAGVDTSFLAFTGPGGQQLRIQWDGANRTVAFNAGPGAATTARPGQMTDNTGAVNTGIAASLTAGVWDATQVQLVEEAIASLVARVNYLEQKILDLGLSV